MFNCETSCGLVLQHSWSPKLNYYKNTSYLIMNKIASLHPELIVLLRVGGSFIYLGMRLLRIMITVTGYSNQLYK